MRQLSQTRHDRVQARIWRVKGVLCPQAIKPAELNRRNLWRHPPLRGLHWPSRQGAGSPGVHQGDLEEMLKACVYLVGGGPALNYALEVLSAFDKMGVAA